jgi:hypothetical protein
MAAHAVILTMLDDLVELASRPPPGEQNDTRTYLKIPDCC